MLLLDAMRRVCILAAIHREAAVAETLSGIGKEEWHGT